MIIWEYFIKYVIKDKLYRRYLWWFVGIIVRLEMVIGNNSGLNDLNMIDYYLVCIF